MSDAATQYAIRLNRTRRMVAVALQAGDMFCLRFHYTDSKQQESIRIVSPMRFDGQHHFLGLCMGREEVRKFDLARIEHIAMVLSADVMAGEPVQEIPRGTLPLQKPSL